MLADMREVETSKSDFDGPARFLRNGRRDAGTEDLNEVENATSPRGSAVGAGTQKASATGTERRHAVTQVQHLMLSCRPLSLRTTIYAGTAAAAHSLITGRSSKKGFKYFEEAC